MKRKSAFLWIWELLWIGALFLSACNPAAASPGITSTVISGGGPAPTVVPSKTRAAPTATHTVTPAPTETETVTPTPRPQIRRVLIISVDGLRPDAISTAPMPNVLALMQSSAYTLTAQTVFPSATLPAHTSMLTGLCPAKHGVDWNDYLPERGYAAGVDLFDLAHAAGLKTVMFVGKEKLRQITEPDSLDVFRYINDRDVVLVERLTEEFPSDFGLLFVHLATADAMGHAYGWLTPQYLNVLQHADEAIGTILKELDDRGLRQDTLVIVTADHGGHEQAHGSRMKEDMTIPWIVNGPGVRSGQLTTPVQTTDTAATAAWALGLARPVEWDGWPVFEAFGQIIQPRPVPFCE